MPQPDEGVLDPYVAKWLEENPEPPWMNEGFPPEILPLARTYAPPTVSQQIDHVDDDSIEGVPVRIYRNEGPPAGIVVYFHGGAFVVGGVSVMDNVARELTHATGAVVISVEYRLAPENPYPAAVEDCEAVTRWVLKNTGQYGVPSTKVVLAGESAGGNLATVVALRMRDDGEPPVAGQVLVYPCVDGAAGSYPSRDQFGRSDWVWTTYGGGKDLEGDPYAFPVQAERLDGLPPALVILAGCDHLRDEGRRYARRLEEAGVEVEEVCFAGQPHGFLNHELPRAAEAYLLIGGWVEAAFAEEP